MFRWVVALLAVSMPAAGVSQTQVAVYGEFSASDLAGGSQGDYLYGGTTGVLLDGPIWFHHLALAADVQGRFITHNGESLNGVTFGPRVSLPLQRFGGFSPLRSFWLDSRDTTTARITRLVSSEENELTQKGDPDRGGKIYLADCSMCHQPNRAGIPPQIPSLIGVVDRLGDEKVRSVSKIGIPDKSPPMPPHPDLTEANIDDLIAFLRAK